MAQTASILESPGIFSGLFDWFFAHPNFKRWSQNRVEWQLHCIGSPGSGKTTLAALAARHLENYFRPLGLVATISVRGYESIQEPDLLEDVLVALYTKLGTWDKSGPDGTEDDHDADVLACSERPGGTRIQLRLILLRKAVYSRLEALEEITQVFLIVDGIDCCNPSLRLLLDAELRELQRRGVSVMITSRVAVYEYWEVKCDHRDHEDAPSIGPGKDFDDSDVELDVAASSAEWSRQEILPGEQELKSGEEEDGKSESEGSMSDEEPDPIDYGIRETLDIYLTCDACKKILCFACHSAGRMCEQCMSNSKLFEDYDHVNITVGTTEGAMKKFIAWDLEREHGDLNLSSSAIKPPLSVLGSSIRDYPGRARAIADQIEDQAEGHIGLAKAGLDLVHDARSVEDLLQLRYQLPSNILELYEAALRSLEAQEVHRRNLGLRVLAAAQYDPDGVEVTYIQEQLQALFEGQSCSGEEITKAARGFLSVMPYGRIPKLVAFHETFWDFIADRYSESLYKASLELQRRDTSSTDFSDDESISTSPAIVRWEPLTLSQEPAKMTPARLRRAVTSMDTISEASPASPVRTYVLRKGTRMWR